MSGGGGGGTTVTKNYSDEESKYREKILGYADQIYNETSGKYKEAGYTGPKPVGPSAETLAGQQAYINAGNKAVAANSDILAAQKYGLTSAMDVNNNPYFQKMLEASMRPYQSALTSNLQGIGSEAIRAGAYGGGRQGVAESLATEKTAQAMGDTVAKLGSAAYDTGQQTFTKTLALAPQTMQSLSTGGNMLSAAGAQQESYAQDQEDYAANQRMWELNSDWAPLQNFANLVYGGGSSQATSTTSAAPKNRLGGALGGAATGAAIAGPWGAAAGAVLGAVL